MTFDVSVIECRRESSGVVVVNYSDWVDWPADEVIAARIAAIEEDWREAVVRAAAALAAAAASDTELVLIPPIEYRP